MGQRNSCWKCRLLNVAQQGRPGVRILGSWLAVLLLHTFVRHQCPHATAVRVKVDPPEEFRSECENFPLPSHCSREEQVGEGLDGPKNLRCLLTMALISSREAYPGIEVLNDHTVLTTLATLARYLGRGKTTVHDQLVRLQRWELLKFERQGRRTRISQIRKVGEIAKCGPRTNIPASGVLH